MAGALPRAQRALGLDAIVLTPLYRGVDRAGLRPIRDGLWESDGVWFLEDALYDRDALYGYADDPARFARLCRAATALADDFDVVHLHDWQAALTAMYLNGHRPCVQTIHNLAYRGDCAMSWADTLGVPDALRRFDGLEFHGRLALLKAGLTLADRITTVSPTYAREILGEPGGHGLSGALRWRRDILSGVLNGLDAAAWPLPATQPTRDGTHCVVISRAAHQKGLDLVIESVDALVEAGARLSVLTSGDADLEAGMRIAAARHPGRVEVTIGFDVERARALYAAADFVLVPSRFEPCGLTQMIAMRYGAIPIVRRTGGLADTVQDGVTGLAFDMPTADALTRTVRRALALTPAERARMQASCAAVDWSWDRSARTYLDVYSSLTQESA